MNSQIASRGASITVSLSSTQVMVAPRAAKLGGLPQAVN